MNRKLMILLALLVETSALAADLRKPLMPVKAPPPPAASLGCYAGVNGGGAIFGAKSSLVLEELLVVPGAGSLKPSGGFLGATLGCGSYFGGWAYFGIEADVDYDATKASQTIEIGEISTQLKSGFFAAEKIKIGVPLGTQAAFLQANSANWPVPINLPANVMLANVMPYLAAGVAERSIRGCLTMVTVGSACGSTWLVGFDAAAGLHIPVAANFGIDVEYSHVFWNKNFTPNGSPFLSLGIAPQFKIGGEDVGLVKGNFYF